jgi:hypothetical protein
MSNGHAPRFPGFGPWGDATDWQTCPNCFAYGAHLILDEHTMSCYDCRYTGVPERPEWDGMCLEHRWAAVAHANGQRAHDSADIRQLLQTIELVLICEELDEQELDSAIDRMLAA